MPKGVYKRIKKAGMFGKKHSIETKRKLSEFNKGKKQSKETVKKRFVWRKKGYTHSNETRLKISESHRGEKSYMWKGGVETENKVVRKGVEFRLWREAVFARDNWTCQKTGVRGGYIVAHHIKNFTEHSELRFAIDNGVTLSEKSHREFHKKYGFKNNTKEQLDEFLLIGFKKRQ